MNPQPSEPRTPNPQPSGSRTPNPQPSGSRTPLRPASITDGEAGGGWLLAGIRYVLPAVVVLAGTVIMALGGESNLEGGAGIISAGLAICFVNWLFRAGAAGERARDTEDAAREYFDRHGRWPE